jgi:hypothetical protein
VTSSKRQSIGSSPFTVSLITVWASRISSLAVVNSAQPQFHLLIASKSSQLIAVDQPTANQYALGQREKAKR